MRKNGQIRFDGVDCKLNLVLLLKCDRINVYFINVLFLPYKHTYTAHNANAWAIYHHSFLRFKAARKLIIRTNSADCTRLPLYYIILYYGPIQLILCWCLWCLDSMRVWLKFICSGEGVEGRNEALQSLCCCTVYKQYTFTISHAVRDNAQLRLDM